MFKKLQIELVNKVPGMVSSKKMFFEKSTKEVGTKLYIENNCAALLAISNSL